MKILDRYVILGFLRNYAISFMVLVGLYVVLDMVFNFNNLVEFQASGSALQNMLSTLRDIGDFYFYQCFLFFVHLSGIIPVVAAAFTLMRLSRFNELTAMLAAGVPLLRIAMPIILVSLALNALLLVDQELVIPAMIPKLTRDHDEVHKQASNYYAVEAMQDYRHALLRVTRYHPKSSPPLMEDMDVIERRLVSHTQTDAQGHAIEEEVWEPFAHVTAKSALWDANQQRWVLSEGRRVEGLKPVDENGHLQRRSGETPVGEYRSNITPEEISLYRSGNYVDLLPTERINQLLMRPESYGTLELLRVKHWRFTQPLMNVILLLLAIPCVLTREPGKLKAAATKCLALTALAMGCIFLSQQFAGRAPGQFPPDRWAALMAWAPVFIFGPLSVFLLDRVKT